MPHGPGHPPRRASHRPGGRKSGSDRQRAHTSDGNRLERPPVELAVVDLDPPVVDLDAAGRCPVPRRWPGPGPAGWRSAGWRRSASGPTARAWASPRSVSGASIRPRSRPSALPVDSPWRTRINIADSEPTPGHRLNGPGCGRTGCRWRTRRAGGAGCARSRRRTGSGGTRRTGHPPAGPPPPRPVGSAAPRTARPDPRGAPRRAGPLPPPRWRWLRRSASRSRRWPPRAGRPRPPAPPTRPGAASAASSGSSSSSSADLLLLELRLTGGQLVDLVVHGLEVAGGRHLPGLHPRLDLVAPPGGGGDLLLQLPLPAGQIVHLACTSAMADVDRVRRRSTSARSARSGKRLDPVPQLVEGGVVVLHHHQGVERFGHQDLLLPSLSLSPVTVPAGSPVSRVRRHGEPRPVHRRRSRSAPSQVNHATSWLSPGPGAGSSSGAHTR